MKNFIYNFAASAIILLLFLSPVIFCQEKVETGDINFKFKGNSSFSEAALLDILLLPREKYFNRINLEEDLQRLNKFYFDNGFFDAVIDTAAKLDKEDDEVDVTFTIHENSRYIIKEVKLQGIDSITPSAKNEILTNRIIDAGTPYSKTSINLEKDRIIGILQNNGYFFAQIDTVRSKIDSSRRGIIIGKYSEELQSDPEYKDKVLIRMRFIGTKDIYRFGTVKIDIEKNKYGIGKPVIERELKFKEGDIYDKSKMLETERNFTKLAIIQLGRVVVDSVDVSSRVVYPDVVISLNNKYELTPGISTIYQSNRLYLDAELEYKDKDFFGGGRVFSAAIEGFYNSSYINGTELSLSIYQPFLFNNDITATFTPKFLYANLQKEVQLLALQNLLRLTYYISDHTFYSNALSDLTFDYTMFKFNGFRTDAGLLTGSLYIVNSIIGITLIHNNTNDLFNPSKGLYHTLTLESAGALPRFISLFNKSLLYTQYAKFNSVNSTYIDISGDRASSIVAAHFEIGDIIEYGSGENISSVPQNYKFFMGGGNSLRGWKAQQGGILQNPSNGGKFLLEGSIEWRRKPFPQRSFLNPVWGVLFLDWGNVWESDSKFRFNQIALSAGFGVRYNTFVGPIRIDLGFRLYDPLAEDGKKWLWDSPKDIFTPQKYAIQFGLGNAF